METMFTPGPWRVGADLCRVHPNWRDEHGNLAAEASHRNGYAKTIATIANENHDWRDIGAQVADAYLIASAPDLYEACQALIDVIDSVDGEADYAKEEWAALGSAKVHAEDQIRAALRKARGDTA